MALSPVEEAKILPVVAGSNYYMEQNPFWKVSLRKLKAAALELLLKTESAQAALPRDVVEFVHQAAQIRLRSYQEAVARAVVASVFQGSGLSFVVMFPRQSGKNELQAQIEAYLLAQLAAQGGEMVKISPTWKPQSLNAMRRLERVLGRNPLTRGRWRKEQGYVYRMGGAHIYFLSGEPTANVVGATASTLLSCDEAQDVLPAKWDKDIAPMAASTNATRVFWGTAWTSQTLLARELRAAQLAEREDGIRRVFILSADDVAREVPAYGLHVAEQVRRMGRQHPLVKTQYFGEELEAQGGLFDESRQAMMQGSHARQVAPQSGKVYALLLDVGGEENGENGAADLNISPGLLAAASAGLRRDSTALTVVEVDLCSLEDEHLRAPTYRVMERRVWTGTMHSALYGEIKALAELWQAKTVVIDATGVGAGLASFLEKALPGKVMPFVFSQKSKSDLGWSFLAVVETGRFKDHAPAAPPSAAGGGSGAQETFINQLRHCQAQVLPGPGRLLRWGVPDGTRDGVTGELVHDDLLLSAALCALLDKLSWGRAESAVVAGRSPLEGMREVF